MRLPVVAAPFILFQGLEYLPGFALGSQRDLAGAALGAPPPPRDLGRSLAGLSATDTQCAVGAGVPPKAPGVASRTLPHHCRIFRLFSRAGGNLEATALAGGRSWVSFVSSLLLL
jgi:hypothetical protein